MIAVRISETSVYFNETKQRYIPEGCHLHVLWRTEKLDFFGRVYLKKNPGEERGTLAIPFGQYIRKIVIINM
jgi:hypothetical protein